MIKIISKQAGFRRCGIAHPATATEYPDDRFTGDELEALESEPMLLVDYIEDGQGPDAKKSGDPKKGKDKKNTQTETPKASGPDILDRDK